MIAAITPILDTHYGDRIPASGKKIPGPAIAFQFGYIGTAISNPIQRIPIAAISSISLLNTMPNRIPDSGKGIPIAAIGRRRQDVLSMTSIILGDFSSSISKSPVKGIQNAAFAVSIYPNRVRSSLT